MREAQLTSPRAAGLTSKSPLGDRLVCPGQHFSRSSGSRPIDEAFLEPYTINEATAITDELIHHPSIRVVGPGTRHWSILQRRMIQGVASGNLVMDAHLAALAIEQNATLCTADNDFRRFSGLRVLNPLEPASH